MTETTLDPDDPLVRRAVFGKQVENFLESDIGIHLVHNAEGEVDKLVEELKTIHPLRVFTIMKLQNKIAVLEHIQQWLADAVVDGIQATDILEDRNG